MMWARTCGTVVTLAFGLLYLQARLFAQATSQTGCTLPAPTFAVNPANNIFNDKQEQDLGDALAELQESDMRIAPPAEDDELTRIGEKLLATLPPTGLHYRFRIYESGEINAFSMPGGRVYISRKLVTAVKNEDELAGVLAHEIGHISTHQMGIEFTRLFRVRIGATQVGDHADIAAKLHQFFNTPPKRREEEDTEKQDQLAADRVALYAMTRAGYAPESFLSFLNESTVNKNKTGSWLTDVFGITNENSQRYRAALQLIAALPAECKGNAAGNSERFLAWQKGVIQERVKNVAAGLAGDQQVTMQSPIRSDLWRISFSPDGHYILAQDESSIAVVDRNEGKVMFRVDAPDANPAQFTPDSHELVFDDTNLRVERWNIETGKRTAVKEMVIYGGCRQSLLTPDGNTLLCLNFNTTQGGYRRIGLRMIDVPSGNTVTEVANFYEFGLSWKSDVAMRANERLGRNLVDTIVSPDGRYLLITAGMDAFAYDLKQRQQIGLGGKLKKPESSHICFIGSNQILISGDTNAKDIYKATIVNFPTGNVVKEVHIGGQNIQGVTNGPNILVRPLKDYAVGILNIDQDKFIGGSKFDAMDTWGNVAAAQDQAGGLVIGTIGTANATHVSLSLGPLALLKAAAFSPDGKYLAVSLRTRAAIWDIQDGKQISLMRPFRSAWIDEQDDLYAQLPKYMEKEPMNLKMELSSGAAGNLGAYDEKGWQYQNLQLALEPLGKEQEIDYDAALEVKPMGAEKTAWRQEFKKETPACWPTEDGRLMLAWDLGSDTAKNKIKANPQLLREAAAFPNQKRGLLLEIVARDTGASLQQVVIPEADLTKGWDDVRRARVSGDSVLVQGEHGNTVIYRIADGTKVGEFFGYLLSSDASLGLIAAVNREDEILLVDERTGAERQRFSLGSPVRLARIVKGTDNVLLVLTADQVVHRLPLPH